MKLNEIFFGSGKSVLRAWIRSFVVVLTVPILLNFIAYRISVAELEKGITQMNLSFYKNAQESIDEDLFMYQRIAVELGSIDVLSGNLLEGSQAEYDALKTQLLSHTIDLQDCYQAYVYLARSGTVITANKIYDARDYYDSHLSELELEYSRWFSWLGKSYSDNVQCVPSKSGDRRFTTLRFPVGSGVQRAYFVVVLNDRFFFNRIKDAPFVGDVSVEILAGEESVASNGGTQLLQAFQKKQAGAQNGVENMWMGGRRYIVTYLESPLNGWKYIYAAPRSLYLRSVRPMAYIQAAVLMAALLVGALLIIMLVKKHYAPIRQFMDLLPDTRPDGSENEYEEIADAIRRAVQGKAQAVDTLVEHREAMQDRALSAVLLGSGGAGDKLEELGIVFPYPNYLVLLFYLGESKLLFIDEKEVADEERLRLMITILQNMLGEALAAAGCWFRFLEVNTACALIVNFDGGEETVAAAVSQTRKNIEEYFYVSFGAALSRVKQEVDALAEAYSESMTVLDYLRLGGECATLRFSELRLGGMGIPSVASQDMESICNFIEDGKTEECMELISILLSRYTDEESYSPALYRYLMSDICAGIIRQFRDEIEEEWITDLYMTQHIIAIADIEAFVKKLTRKINGDSKGQMGREGKQQLALEIRRYLEENYTDSELNVSKTADQFGYVLSYVSRVFKESEGIGIVDYINRLRIEDTKKYLCATRLPLQEIADRVGFNNVASLIRVFKKFEGMTPSNYKKSIGGPQKEERP